MALALTVAELATLAVREVAEETTGGSMRWKWGMKEQKSFVEPPTSQRALTDPTSSDCPE